MTLTTPKALVKALKEHGSLKAASRATGTSWGATHNLYKRALADELLQPLKQGAHSKEIITKRVKGGGRVKVLKPIEIDCVPRGGVRRYIFSGAQNNTKLHDKFWDNLLAFADYTGARIVLSRFTYSKRWTHQMDKADLGAPSGDKQESMWWDERLLPYFVDRRAEIAPGLAWCGEMNIIPTAARPLTGLESYTGRASGIFPATKLAMDSIPSHKYEPTKFNYTTGAITQRNYIMRKEGLKAQFHHCYGALLVEVDKEGNWFVRQLNADSTGTFYDTARMSDDQVGALRAKDGEVTDGHRVDLVLGDTHVAQKDETAHKVVWDEGGMVDALQPKNVVHHDVLDFYSQNHHEIDNVHTVFRKYVEGTLSVGAELVGVVDYFKDIARPDTNNVVADSNHHHALGRWLRERNGLKDPSNAEIWLKLNDLVFTAIRQDVAEPNYLRLAMEAMEGKGFERKYGVRFLDEDESFILANDAHGGIECGMHGDLGPNGARGGRANFARMGRKAIRGHEHSASIYDGVYTVGCMCVLDPAYVRGPSSWSHTQCGIYPNGKRVMLTIWAGKWRAL
jgi:hypothetical protein